MNSIMGPIGLEQLKLFALELGKIATVEFVYSLASTNINQSAPNLCPVRLGSTKKRMLLTEEIGIEKSIERISGIRTIQNGGRGIN